MFGQDPFRLLHDWTNRQGLAAARWLETRMNLPSREDYYAMRVALTISQSLGGSQEGDLSKFAIDFHKVEQQPPSTQDQSLVNPEAVWGAILRGQKRGRPGN